MSTMDELEWRKRLEELRRALEREVLRRAYGAVSVSPDDVLAELREGGVPVSDLAGVVRRPSTDLDPFAERAIRRSRRTTAVVGATAGAGGALGLVPVLAHLAVVLLRLSQTLSLVYGFDHRTQRGQIDLWKALSRGLGVAEDVEGFEGTRADLGSRLPSVVARGAPGANPLAVRMAQAVAARLLESVPANAARLVPVVGGGASVILGWRQVGRAGSKMREHFRSAHDLACLDLSRATEAEIVRE